MLGLRADVGRAAGGRLLALVVSDQIYREVVADDPAAEPESYRSIAGSFEDSSTPAWLRLFGGAPAVNIDVLNSLDPRSSRNWSRYRELDSPEQESGLVESSDSRSREVVIKLMQYLYFHGAHERVAGLARRARTEWSERLGEADPQTLSAAGYLGLFLWALGSFDEAAEVNQRVLELRRQKSADTADTIIAELRVALDVRTRGEFATARELNEGLYATATQRFTDDDPITLQTAHDLAVVTRLCGDYRRALELDERTSELRASVLGQDSPDTLNTLSGVHMDRRELGEYRSALDGHELVANLVRESLGLGEDAPDMLRRSAYLAVARRKAGDYAGALELSGTTLELYRRRYPSTHPSALACALGHATDLRHDKQFAKAREVGEQTVAGYRASLREDHPLTLSALANSAVLLRVAGDAAGARQLNEQTLKKLRGTLESDHPHAIACEINMASDLAAMARIEEAAAVDAAAVARAERVLGADHPITLTARLNLALDRRAAQGAEADAQFADAVDRYRRVLGDKHPETLSVTGGDRANCDIDPLPL